MKTISLLHPFSAKAIGLTKQDLFYSHSKPHEMAMLKLQEEGYDVSIDYFNDNIIPFTKSIDNITKNFWPITKPFFKNRNKWRKQHSLYHYYHSYLSTPDVTIINMSGHGSKYCFKLAKMLVAKKKPYITMIGGIHISSNEQTATYYKNAHHIIVHTEIQKNELLQNKIFKELTIQVMPLGINTEIFKPIEKTATSINLLFVGRISRLKQIELCLETVALLVKNLADTVSLKIVGPISDEIYFEELKVIVKNLHITDYVSFEGSVEQKLLVPYYQLADLLLLPSAHESFGMVMIEAMACGTPVAAITGAGGPDEIIEDEINGILTIKETYSKRILEFFKNIQLQVNSGENARQKAVAEYSIDATFKVIERSINSAIKKS